MNVVCFLSYVDPTLIFMCVCVGGCTGHDTRKGTMGGRKRELEGERLVECG